jgi:THO complex subunit 2
MRENNEGYTKLTLLLINLRDNHDINAVWKKIVSLVGNFDLDPDRVLDLIVEARMQNNSTRNYLKILTNFRRESITVILGNKLKLIKGKPIEASVYEKIIYAGPI